MVKYGNYEYTCGNSGCRMHGIVQRRSPGDDYVKSLICSSCAGKLRVCYKE